MQQPVILTRRELYELIWSKPMLKLAEEFGISDRGLAKICERHRVTGPTRGYWAKLAAGKKVKQSIFREVNDPDLNRIVIAASISAIPEAARSVVEAIRAQRREKKAAVPEVAAHPAPVFEPIEKPHRAIAATARALRKAKPDPYGGIGAHGEGLCGVSLHADRAERAIAFLDALARGLEAAGLELLAGGNSMKLAVGPDKIAFTLTEKTRRVAHTPTPEEIAENDRREERRSRAQRRNDWDAAAAIGYGNVWPEFDTVYSGQLVLALDGWADGLRKTWGDGKTQSVERMLDSIIDGIRVILASQKAKREEGEAREKRWAELQRRRDLAAKRVKREERRITYLRELVELQREARDIRIWLASLPETAVAEASTDLGRMMLWAEARLVALDARTSVDAARTTLDGKDLFPENDELHDPLGDPPERQGYW